MQGCRAIIDVQMQIIVRFSPDKTTNVEVESDLIVEKLKERMQELVQCPLYEQRLVFDGTILDDGRTLGHYNVTNKSTLYLVPVEGLHSLIYVKTSRWKIITVEIWHTDTIYEIKSKVEREEYIPRHKQVLLFNGKELEDDRTRAHYRIDAGSTLHLVENYGDLVGDIMAQRFKRARTASILDTYNGELRNSADIALIQPKANTGFSSLVSTELEALKHELAAAQCKKKEADATISKLTYELEVASARCTSHERQLAALEAENKKMKELLMVADQKNSEAGTAGYAEGS